MRYAENGKATADDADFTDGDCSSSRVGCFEVDPEMQAARLPLQIYFGAREATIFSKRGSPRSGSHHGISFNSP